MKERDLPRLLEKGRELVSSLEGSMAFLTRAEDRARQLLASVPASPMFVGVMGLELEPTQFEIVPGMVIIRTVSNAPGIIHLCQAADLARTDYLSVARYSSAIRVELAAGDLAQDREANDPNRLLDYAWHCAALIKLRGHANLVCPAFTNASWDTVAIQKGQNLTFQILDDVPRQLAGGEPHAATIAELEWVRDHFLALLEMRDRETSRRFSLAFDVMYRWNHTTDVRVAIQNVWCGLEALFGDRRDRRVTQALIDRMTAWLPATGADRVRELYDRRCDACHGRHLDEKAFHGAAVDAAALLNAALIRAIETRTRTLPDWEP